MIKARGSFSHSLLITLESELHETFRARWFHFYVASFGLLWGIFLAFGLHESSILGFTGLGRSLLTFTQMSLIVVPLFVVLSTARTFVADFESGVWEYLLSWPFHLRGYFFGRALGRFVALVLPFLIVLFVSGFGTALNGGEVPWVTLVFLMLFMASMVFFFLGVGLCLSVWVKTQEQAIGIGMGVWLFFEAIVDALLLGVLVKQQVPAEIVIGMAMFNPLQAFRTASIALFDPQLTVLGPISYTLLEVFGSQGLAYWAVAWPMVAGTGLVFLATRNFIRKDFAAG